MTQRTIADSTLRKPKVMKTVQAEAIREKFIEMVQSRHEALIEAQIKSALGEVVLWRTDHEGKTTTMNTAPDTQAAKFLYENAIGRPKERIEHSGAIGLVALVARLEQDV